MPDPPRVLLVGERGRFSRLRADLEAAGLEVLDAPSAPADLDATEAADVIVLFDDRALGRLADEWGAREGGAPAMVVATRDEAVAAELGTLDLPGWAIVPPDVSGVELAAAIVAAARGFAVRPASSGAPDPNDEAQQLLEALTSREHEVLELLAEGLPNKAIAGRLGISEHTVKFHIAAIFGKLGVSTRTEAVRQGVRAGLITL